MDRASRTSDCRLEPRHGRPTVVVDGRPVPFAAYCDCIDFRPDAWRRHHDEFIASGVRIFFVNVALAGFWPGGSGRDEPPYPTSLGADAEAEHILARAPDAWLIARWGATPPPSWAEANAGEMQRDSAGTRFKEASLASAPFIDALRAAGPAALRWCRGRPWGGRVIGWMVFPDGEGLTPLSISGGFFDRSDAMRGAWAAWLRARHGDDARLRAAWGRDDVALDAPPLPSDDELRVKLARLPHWPDPREVRPEREYALLQRELFARWLRALVEPLAAAVAADRPALVGVDALKQPLLGWQIQRAFAGAGRGPDAFSLACATGSIDVGALLDLPGLDCLITPADYHARGVGQGFDGEGLSDSLVLRGKTLIVENDARTFLSTEAGGAPPLGAFRDLAEVRAGLLRNTAACASRGLLPYWMDIANGFFADAGIQQAVRADRAVIERVATLPHQETEHAIALVIDDASPLEEDFTSGFQDLAVIRQRIDGLALCGIPYRVLLLSDLERAAVPPYRCWLFPNLFRVDERVVALLRRTVLRDGRIAIFGPGTGITDGETVSAAGAERLLGMPMALHRRTAPRRVRLRDPSHRALRARGVPAVFGDSYAYGPVLAPDARRLAGSGVVTLGDAVFAWPIDAPGLALKEHGRGAAGNGDGGPRGPDDYAVVFSGAVPLPPPLLRALAGYGGCHVWCDDDVVVAASGTIVSLHATSPGPHRLRLPRRAARLVDAVTGAEVGRDLDELSLRLEPPETRLFIVER